MFGERDFAIEQRLRESEGTPRNFRLDLLVATSRMALNIEGWRVAKTRTVEIYFSITNRRDASVVFIVAKNPQDHWLWMLGSFEDLLYPLALHAPQREQAWLQAQLRRRNLLPVTH